MYEYRIPDEAKTQQDRMVVDQIEQLLLPPPSFSHCYIIWIMISVWTPSGMFCKLEWHSWAMMASSSLRNSFCPRLAVLVKRGHIWLNSCFMTLPPQLAPILLFCWSRIKFCQATWARNQIHLGFGPQIAVSLPLSWRNDMPILKLSIKFSPIYF